MARVTLPQSKVRARRRRRRLVISSGIAGAVLLAFVALVLFAHAPFMHITTVTVSGEKTLDASDIQTAVLGDISGSYLFVFPKSNIFLYPKYATEESLLKEMPTLSAVSINAKDFHTLSVSVTERARKALWCGNTVAEASACFWLDENGVAYAAASDLSLGLNNASSSYEHYFGVLNGSSPQQFVTPDQFHSLTALVDTLQQNQSANPITSVEVDVVGDVRVTFADNFVLLFNLSSAGADVYQRFTLALSSDAFLGHTLADFEYLDLRFGDKLYYKVRDAETPVKSK